ncbi:MAG: crosslink repair DNA glycosylase YcaQ family protein [Marmoricola sp.]
MEITRDQVLRFRVHAQQLDRTQTGEVSTAAEVLDLGVQDTGPDGSRWALELRGFSPDPADLFLAWTLRGAPHVYRRAQAAAVAAATAPVSESDAAKRIFDASKPLKDAGIPVLDALDRIAEEMRSLVTTPTVKGDLSGALHERLPDPYQRYCKPCDAVHLYEQPFRLAALRGGLELQPGTSPPVIERIKGWRGMARTVEPSLDPVRAALRLLGPATVKQVATYLDSPVKDVRARWPDDVETVTVDGEQRDLLAQDVEALSSPADVSDVVRLLGPFDLLLQGRDRELAVPDEAHRKDLWRILGRPGGVLVGHEILGSWRPRMSGRKLRVAVDPWAPLPDLTEQAERLAAFRGVTFDGFVDA